MQIADLMDKVKKHWQNRSSEDHWIFGTSTHFEDSNLYMKPVRLRAPLGAV